MVPETRSTATYPPEPLVGLPPASISPLEAASRSPWVAPELLTAFHLGRFIVPATLDKTHLPQFIQNTVYLDPGRRGEAVL